MGLSVLIQSKIKFERTRKQAQGRIVKKRWRGEAWAKETLRGGETKASERGAEAN